ncbi:MAG: SDR family oxidoreductase [Promethearchaeota archaeon]|nr:MAG: SDR family oxidoreductase [Candidatus Lokiarchaeota archaeon]
MSIPNNHVLITGASSGIGRACAEYLASNGFKVYAGARKQHDIKELSNIENINALEIDVTKQDTIERAIEYIRNQKTGLCALINNAGIARAGPLMELPVDELHEQFDVNLFGIHRITKAVFPFLLQSKGKIIMMSSDSGFFATPFFGPYCSSKFALEGYSDSLRRELLIFDVNVVIIEPGRVKTSIWDKGEELFKSLISRLKGSIFETIAKEVGEYAIRKGKTEGLNPKEVAKLVYKILLVKEPKTRYLIAPDKLRYRLIKILPDKTIDKKFEKEFKNLK